MCARACRPREQSQPPRSPPVFLPRPGPRPRPWRHKGDADRARAFPPSHQAKSRELHPPLPQDEPERCAELLPRGGHAKRQSWPEKSSPFLPDRCQRPYRSSGSNRENAFALDFWARPTFSLSLESADCPGDHAIHPTSLGKPFRGIV